jgi:tetratricopeptide (TPR) repeat protein
LAQLEAADKETDRGNYAGALTLAGEARRFAVRADDPVLIIRSGLSRGNILSFLGRPDEAQAAFEGALAEAERIGDAGLGALCRVYMARRLLLAGGGNAGDIAGGKAGGIAAKLRDQVKGELALMKADQNGLALGWTVIGLAEKELGNWAEAERAIKNALDIHVKDGRLELAAYDWYLTASIRSVSGRYQDALDALEEALSYDRRAENSYGLGMDWKAMGDVYQREGKDGAADIAYRRAAEIFRSINMETEAGEVEGKVTGGRE